MSRASKGEPAECLPSHLSPHISQSQPLTHSQSKPLDKQASQNQHPNPLSFPQNSKHKAKQTPTANQAKHHHCQHQGRSRGGREHKGEGEDDGTRTASATASNHHRTRTRSTKGARGAPAHVHHHHRDDHHCRPSPKPTKTSRDPEMEEAMANLNLNDFEFFKIMLPEVTTEKLRLPDKFARELKYRELRDAKLQVAGEGQRLWDVKVVVDGDTYLDRGWQQFARAHDLQVGHLLVFRFDGTAVFTVTVFDDSMCRRHYHHEDAAGSGSGTATMNIEAPSQFTVTLRQCNLREKQNQYLNVPVEFQDAHGYVSMRRVVLKMGGSQWPVKLKHGSRPGGRGNRTTFRYGWHKFCVDNGLGVGDTCFFRVLREGDGRVLKVEVRKRDGTFLDRR